MSSTYCTINCKQCAATIRIPDDKDTTFVCSSCKTTMQSKGINIIVVPADRSLSADNIAEDINNRLRKIVSLAKGFETARLFSPEENAIQVAIADELMILYNKIVFYYNEDNEASATAFKKRFHYDQMFDRPQTLDLILAGVYRLLFGVRQTTMFDFFTTVDHEMYAFGVVQANQQRLASANN